MVQTRAARHASASADEGAGARGQKRSRSPSLPVTSRKTRKGHQGRHSILATPDAQLLEEEREASMDRSRASSFNPFTQTAEPTKSTHDTPLQVKYRSLKNTLKRRSDFDRKRAEEGGGDNNMEDSPEDKSTFIEPADLNIAPLPQLRTPARRVDQLRRTTSTWTPNTISSRRESVIQGYEAQLGMLSKEIEAQTTKVNKLRLGLLNLGFEGQNADDMCVTIRSRFDETRDLLVELFPDKGIEALSNEEILSQIPDLVHTQLAENEDLLVKLHNTEAVRDHVRDEYNAVVGKLAERDDRVRAVEKIMNELDEDLQSELEKNAALTGENVTLTDDVAAKLQNIEDLNAELNDYLENLATRSAEVEALTKELANVKAAKSEGEARAAQEYAEKEAERLEDIDRMVEELTQEHGFRLIAEKDIVAKDGEITGLQIKYTETWNQLDDANRTLITANAQIREHEQQIASLEDDICDKDAANDILEQKIERLEADAEELNKAAAELAGLREADAEVRSKLQQELNDVNDLIDTQHHKLKDRNLELNKLKSDLFGVQQERDGKIRNVAKLEKDIAKLNNAMNDLQNEKDGVIDEKNKLLDERDAELDDAAIKLEDTITAKDEIIASREADIDKINDKLAEAKDANKKLANDNKKLSEDAAAKDEFNQGLQDDLRKSQGLNKKLESDVKIRDAEIKALKAEVHETIAHRDLLQHDLADAEKEYADLRKAYDQLVQDAKRDSKLAKEWAAEKDSKLAEAERVSNGASPAAVASAGALATPGHSQVRTQPMAEIQQTDAQVVKSVVTKKRVTRATASRDSGYYAEMDEETEEDEVALTVE